MIHKGAVCKNVILRPNRTIIFQIMRNSIVFKTLQIIDNDKRHALLKFLSVTFGVLHRAHEFLVCLDSTQSIFGF